MKNNAHIRLPHQCAARARSPSARAREGAPGRATRAPPGRTKKKIEAGSRSAPARRRARDTGKRDETLRFLLGAPGRDPCPGRDPSQAKQGEGAPQGAASSGAEARLRTAQALQGQAVRPWLTAAASSASSYHTGTAGAVVGAVEWRTPP